MRTVPSSSSAPQHVWVSQTGVWRDDRAPGILMEWLRDPETGEWFGYVIAVERGIDAHRDGPYVHQGWFPAAKIAPAATG